MVNAHSGPWRSSTLTGECKPSHVLVTAVDDSYRFTEPKPCYFLLASLGIRAWSERVSCRSYYLDSSCPTTPTTRMLPPRGGSAIQTDSVRGHSSVEDATAALDLLREKLRQPPGFGEEEQKEESVIELLGRHGKRVFMAGRIGTAKAGKYTEAGAEVAAQALGDDPAAALVEAVQDRPPDLAYIKLTAIEHGDDVQLDPARTGAIGAINAELTAALAAYSTSRALVAVIGCPGVGEVFELHRKKREARHGATSWGSEQTERLKHAVTRARGGLLFVRCTAANQNPATVPQTAGAG